MAETETHISSLAYDTLKHQVYALKHEQQSLAALRSKQKEVETAALVQQKLQYEEQLHSLRQELGSLQQRLKESVERASRVRQHAERDQRGITQQLEKLQQVLASAQGQHDQALAAAQAAHVQQLKHIKDELEARRQQWDAEKQQLQEQQAAFMSEVEEWSQGEVEAIQAAAAARLDDEQRQGQQWKAKHADLQLQLDAVQQHNAALQEQLERKVQEYSDSCGSGREQAAAMAVVQQQLQVLEGRLLEQAQQRGQEQQQWQQQMAVAAQQAQAREVQLQTQHAAEMDAVHRRLQEVLRRKDATIASLQDELACTLSRLEQATQELMG